MSGERLALFSCFFFLGGGGGGSLATFAICGYTPAARLVFRVDDDALYLRAF